MTIDLGNPIGITFGDIALYACEQQHIVRVRFKRIGPGASTEDGAVDEAIIDCPRCQGQPDGVYEVQ
jgi:hypothetical protein